MNLRPQIFWRKLVVLTIVGGSKKVRSSDSVNVANEARHISVSRSPALLSTRQDQACSGFKFQPFRFDEIIYQPCSIRIRYILHDQRRPTGNWIWNYNLDRMMISSLVCSSTVLLHNGSKTFYEVANRKAINTPTTISPRNQIHFFVNM